MTFLWPLMLLSVALVPLGVLLHLALGRRRGRRAAVGGLGLERAAIRRPLGLRGRIPPALFLTGFAVMAVGLARPQTVVDVPREEGTVMLAFDVSGSMAATDLAPTRMDAAKAATTDFVQNQPSSVVIGVVAFSDAGVSVQTPTDDQGAVLAAINRLAPQRGTSLGQGIQASLDAIAAVSAPQAVGYYTTQTPAPTPTPTPVPAGTYAPAVIILLTDGENNENPDPLAAAQAAANEGVRIDTVAIGSPAGTTLDVNGFKVHTQLNADLLRQISEATGGTYYDAQNEQDLRSIYDTLDTQLVSKPESIEVTSLFAGAGVVLLVAGGLTSLLWLGRLP